MNDKNSFNSSNSKVVEILPRKYNMELSELFSKMFSVDEEVLIDEVDYKIDNRPKGKIFSKFNEKKALQKNTYRNFFMILSDDSSYETEMPSVKNLSNVEIELQFVRYIMSTEIFLHALSFLKKKGIISTSDELGGIIYSMWFSHIDRSSSEVKTVSSFQSVFGNDMSKNITNPISNWLKYYQCERYDQIEFLNWDKDPIVYKDKVFLISLVYKCLNDIEQKSEFLVGFSPELEILMYTVISLTYGQSFQRIMIEGERTFDIVLIEDKNNIKSAFCKIVSSNFN